MVEATTLFLLQTSLLLNQVKHQGASPDTGKYSQRSPGENNSDVTSWKVTRKCLGQKEWEPVEVKGLNSNGTSHH